MSKNDLTFRLSKGKPLSFVETDANIDRLMYWSGQWEAGHQYTPNEMVWYRGGLYVCIATVIVDTPPNYLAPEWQFIAYMPNSADLYGAPANFSPGATYTAIQNWPSESHNGEFVDTPPTPATGIITLPVAGIYNVNANIIFQQGNTNKELAILLWLRSSVNGDFVIDAMQVSDDKTDWRALGASFRYDGAAGETFQLGLSWVNQTIGTASFQPCTFECTLELPVDL